MEGVQPRSRLVSAIVDAGVLGNDPFVLVDVGCSQGIDGGWRVFGRDLIAFGFDPNLDEVERLIAEETHQRITYTAGWVGLPEDHDFLAERDGHPPVSRNPWARLSVTAAIEQQTTSSAAELAACNQWARARLAPPDQTIVLPEFLREHGLDHIDFLKLDIDGEDFQVLVSLDELLRDSVLGIGMEVNFFGSERPADHSFHNTDRYLKERGLELFALSTRKYSLSALPARFEFAFPAQTTGGRVYQGDAIYFHDLANPEHIPRFEREPATRLLKLAGMFDICGLPDCAAEILVMGESRIEKLTSLSPLLDALVPEPFAREMSYSDYIARFAAGDQMFYSAS